MLLYIDYLVHKIYRQFTPSPICTFHKRKCNLRGQGFPQAFCSAIDFVFEDRVLKLRSCPIQGDASAKSNSKQGGPWLNPLEDF